MPPSPWPARARPPPGSAVRAAAAASSSGACQRCGLRRGRPECSASHPAAEPAGAEHAQCGAPGPCCRRRVLAAAAGGGGARGEPGRREVPRPRGRGRPPGDPGPEARPGAELGVPGWPLLAEGLFPAKGTYFRRRGAWAARGIIAGRSASFHRNFSERRSALLFQEAGRSRAPPRTPGRARPSPRPPAERPAGPALRASGDCAARSPPGGRMEGASQGSLWLPWVGSGSLKMVFLRTIFSVCVFLMNS